MTAHERQKRVAVPAVKRLLPKTIEEGERIEQRERSLIRITQKIKR